MSVDLVCNCFLVINLFADLASLALSRGSLCLQCDILLTIICFVGLKQGKEQEQQFFPNSNPIPPPSKILLFFCKTGQTNGNPSLFPPSLSRTLQCVCSLSYGLLTYPFILNFPLSKVFCKQDVRHMKQIKMYLKGNTNCKKSKQNATKIERKSNFSQ